MWTISAVVVALLGSVNSSVVPFPAYDGPRLRVDGSVEFPNAPMGARVGEPDLPLSVQWVSVPEGVDPARVRVKEIPGRILRWPGKWQIAIVEDQRAQGDLGHRDSTRGKFRPFRGQVSDEGRWWKASWAGLKGGKRMVRIEFSPFRWDVKTGRLWQMRGGALQIDFPTTVAAARRGFTGNVSARPGLLIATTDSFVKVSAKLDSFASLRTRQGNSVQLLTPTRWLDWADSVGWGCHNEPCGGGWGGGVGDVAAERLRTWLQANALVSGVKTLLLVGNPDPVKGDVPMKMAWPRSAMATYREAPTDFYYAELSGDWDLDGDGLVGEFPDDLGEGGADPFAELAVGRLPYTGDVKFVDQMLQKAMDYSREISPTWRKNALLPMVPTDASTPGYQLGEQINDSVLVPLGWSSTRAYQTDFGVSPEIHPSSYAAISAAWSSVPRGLVVWWTHGSARSAMDVFLPSTAARLDPTHPSFVFSAGCVNGQPEDKDNLAHQLVRTGAIGIVAASRVTWYRVGQTDFASQVYTGPSMAFRFAKELATQNLAAGEALAEMRGATNASSTTSWMNLLVFNLYGDPSLSLGSSAPALPDSVKNLVAQVQDLAILLQWDPVLGAESYQVERGSAADSVFSLVQTVADPVWLDSPLPNGEAVLHRVRACNSTGCGPYSEAIQSTPEGWLDPLILHLP